MWASEYVTAATARISDPVRAAEVTRELLTHLEEIKAEAIAAGVEADMAEAMALTRMGPVEALAQSLAETHHSPLPWRHYLALVPAGGLLVLMMGPPHLMWPLASWLILMLVACLLPGPAIWRRFGLWVMADVRVKSGWLWKQPLGSSAGVALLGMAGVGLCLLLFVMSLDAGYGSRVNVPLGLLLSALPLPLAARWGQGRYGLSPYLVVVLAVFEGLALLMLVQLLSVGRIAWDLGVVLATGFLPGGLLLTWGLQWWSKRQLSIRVVVESEKRVAN